MTTSVQDVISVAYRRSGVVAAGVTIDAVQQGIGLERLQDFFITQMNTGLFGTLTDYYLASGNYTANEGERVFKKTPASVVSTPTTVVDDMTGATRAPLDGSIIAVVDPTVAPVMYVYDGMAALWQSIGSLALGNVCPMTARFPDAIKNLLAIHLCDEIGFPIAPLLAHNAGLGKLALASRYGSTRPRAIPDYF